jgi:hypothetical protein
MDLQLEDNATNSVIAVNGGGTFDQLTFLRIDVRSVAFGWSGFLWKAGLVRMWDQLTIADSTVDTLQAGGGNAMFIAATRMAILGNSLDNAGGGEHNFRSMYFDKMVVSNNLFTRPAATKANITLRAPDFVASPAGSQAPVADNTYSQFAVVSDNQAIGFAGVNQPVNTSIDGAHDARTRQIVFERNWLHSYPGSGAGFNAIRFHSDSSTIRNNVVDLSGIATTGDVCIDIRANGNPTQPNPTGNWIYNNTCYSTTAYTGVLFPLSWGKPCGNRHQYDRQEQPGLFAECGGADHRRQRRKGCRNRHHRRQRHIRQLFGRAGDHRARDLHQPCIAPDPGRRQADGGLCHRRRRCCPGRDRRLFPRSATRVADYRCSSALIALALGGRRNRWPPFR